MYDLSIFPKISNGSGASGYFGDKDDHEYWYQKWLARLGLLNTDGLGFVSKTTPIEYRAGNMALTSDYKPRDWYPDCMVFDFWSGNGLNAVGVPTPGLPALLATGKWQKRTQPFFISVMSMAPTHEARLGEFRRIEYILRECKKEFRAPFGLKINLSCPNDKDVNPSQLIQGSADVLETLAPLGVWLIPKYSIASAPIPAIMELEHNPHCAGVCFSNTWPYYFDEFGRKVFGKKKSPLDHLGGGGVSGKALRKRVCAYIRQLRQAGFTKHIRGVGGIFSCTDVRHYWRAGASSCEISTVIPTRPWLVRGIIQQANKLTWRKP